MRKSLFLFFGLLIFFVSPNLYAMQKDKYSIFFKLVRPNKSLNTEKEFASSVKTIKNFYGGGLKYNALTLDYSNYFNGRRAIVTYSFLRDSMVSPYLGLSYTWGTNVVNIYKNGKMDYADRYDGIVGASLNLFNDYIAPFNGYIAPYFEYTLSYPSLNVGVRVHLGWSSVRK